MTKIYIKIGRHVFTALPSQTELSYSQDTQCGPRVVSFRAAITNEQPWSCKLQKFWGNMPKKQRKVNIVMVTDDGATEWVFKDVDITYMSDIQGEEFTAKGPKACRPLIPMVKGESMSEVETITHTHAWWQ